MSHAVQLRLLRVLDAKEVMHVGGDRFIPSTCGSFAPRTSSCWIWSRWARSGWICISVWRASALKSPPLRDRLEDVPLLIANVLKRYGKNASVVTPAILDAIRRYSWPGNIRELMSVMESYLVLLGDNSSSLACFEEIFRHRNQFFDKARRGGRWGNSLPRTVWRLSARRCGAVRATAEKRPGLWESVTAA